MPINIGRCPGVAEVRIDHDACTKCALCVQVCAGGPLYMQDGKVQVDQSRGFGCVACGHCVTICPKGCIEVAGRDLLPSDVLPMPPQESRASYDQLQSLLLARRSVRLFQDKEIEREVIHKIIAAASTAPMGVPPSEVGVLVFAGRSEVAEFKDDLLQGLRASKWMFSRWGIALMRPMMGKEGADAMREFVVPVVEMYEKKDAEGQDWFFYDAPLALYFYGSPCADPADPVIAGTYAMLAGESLGLGTCVLGFPPPIMKFSKKLRQKYGLPKRFQSGMALVLGYPLLRHPRAIKRRFAEVRYFGSE